MNRTKVVVFDFDHTLYNNVVYEDWQNYCTKGLRRLLSFLDEVTIEKIINNQKEFGDLNIIQTLIEQGLSVDDWINYRKQNLRSFDISNATAVNKTVLKEFADKYILYIVSHNQRFDVERVAKAMKINLKMFKDILTNTFKDGLFSKKYLYNKIIEREKIKPDELFVIGDDYEYDIKPALEICARGQQVTGCAFKLEDFEL